MKITRRGFDWILLVVVAMTASSALAGGDEWTMFVIRSGALDLDAASASLPIGDSLDSPGGWMTGPVSSSGGHSPDGPVDYSFPVSENYSSYEGRTPKQGKLKLKGDPYSGFLELPVGRLVYPWEEAGIEEAAWVIETRGEFNVFRVLGVSPRVVRRVRHRNIVHQKTVNSQLGVRGEVVCRIARQEDGEQFLIRMTSLDHADGFPDRFPLNTEVAEIERDVSAWGKNLFETALDSLYYMVLADRLDELERP